jgi:uncharacterized protein YcbK (DUF882 family)
MITSGVRCAKHNTRVGGAKNSYHVTGMAADLKVVGLTTAGLYSIAKGIPELRGFGLDHNFLHVDVRKTPAKWAYKNGKVVSA